MAVQLKPACIWFLNLLRRTSQILNTGINVTAAITVAGIVRLTVS